jgi:hypothetical protein
MALPLATKIDAQLSVAQDTVINLQEIDGGRRPNALFARRFVLRSGVCTHCPPAKRPGSTELRRKAILIRLSDCDIMRHLRAVAEKAQVEGAVCCPSFSMTI